MAGYLRLWKEAALASVSLLVIGGLMVITGWEDSDFSEDRVAAGILYALYVHAAVVLGLVLVGASLIVMRLAVQSRAGEGRLFWVRLGLLCVPGLVWLYVAMLLARFYVG